MFVVLSFPPVPAPCGLYVHGRFRACLYCAINQCVANGSVISTCLLCNQHPFTMQTAPVYRVICTLLPCGRFSVNMAQSYKKNIKQPKEGTENVLADRFSVPSRVFPRCFSVYKVVDVMRPSRALRGSYFMFLPCLPAVCRGLVALLYDVQALRQCVEVGACGVGLYGHALRVAYREGLRIVDNSVADAGRCVYGELQR